jgi:hypothetical protein
VFKSLREQLPQGLAHLDRDLADLVDGYLVSLGVKYRRSEKAGRALFEIVSDGLLPAEMGEGRRFATGDARSLNDAEALNLVHPLVRAAIADARRWPGGPVALRLPSDAPGDLVAMTGRAGVVLESYALF